MIKTKERKKKKKNQARKREQNETRLIHRKAKNWVLEGVRPHQYEYSPYCSPYISKGADKENVFNNQERPSFVINYLIHATLMCDSGVIL